MKAKFINEKFYGGRTIKIKCETNSDCGSIGDFLSGKGIVNFINPSNMVITIQTGDNDPNEILAIIDNLPFSTKIFEKISIKDQNLVDKAKKMDYIDWMLVDKMKDDAESDKTKEKLDQISQYMYHKEEHSGDVL